MAINKEHGQLLAHKTSFPLVTLTRALVPRKREQQNSSEKTSHE
jgi:hypothetical protein